MIALKDVCKSYQEGGALRSVLNSVNMSIDTGEFVAVQGSSGSGKSTLLNIIAGLDLSDSGTVEVGGAEINTMSEHKRTLFRRKNIGFVFQFFSLIPTLTVAENVGLGLELNDREVELEARVSFLLENIGLADRCNSYPDRLSGGEQQRVAIARAIAHDPPLILADEPTGNLDVATANTTLGLLERLQKRQGVTLVVATHSTEVARRADRALQLREIQG